MINDHPVSRRQMIGGLSSGLAATVAATTVTAPVFASSTPGETPNAAALPALVDPTTKYPKPPFKAQPQPSPPIIWRLLTG